MNIKEKMVVLCSIVVMTLCVLFGVAWVASGTGYGNFDLPILLKGIEVVQGVLNAFINWQLP